MFFPNYFKRPFIVLTLVLAPDWFYIYPIAFRSSLISIYDTASTSLKFNSNPRARPKTLDGKERTL